MNSIKVTLISDKAVLIGDGCSGWNVERSCLTLVVMIRSYGEKVRDA